MIETESIDNGEQLPSKNRQRSPLVMPSTSDSSPKIEELKEKRISKKQDSSYLDQVILQQEQSSSSPILQDNSSSIGSLTQIQQQISKLTAQQLSQTLQYAAENSNFSIQQIQYCKRHSIPYSPNLSQKSNSNNRSSITNQSNNGNNVSTNLGEEIDSSIEAFKSKKILKHSKSKQDIFNKTISNNKNIQFAEPNKNTEMKHYNNPLTTMCGSHTQIEDNDNSSDSQQSSDCDSSESSSEEYIQQCEKKQLGLTRSKNISSDSTNASYNHQSSNSSSQLQQNNQQQQYPLQFICVELNCTESTKYCCVKCLSSGGHENHQAICVKTINQQIKSQMTMNKLSSVKLKIDQLFDNLSDKLKQCRDTLNTQFNAAQINLQQEAEHALNPNSTLEKKVQIWKAYYQSEQAIIMEHLNFILEKSDNYFNQIGSRIVNLNPKQILHIKQFTKHDIVFQQQLKSVEEELQRAESNLSTRAKQALAALPQFNFQSQEFENNQAVSLKKFEYPERIEFCQVDKKGEQNGRCLIFWRDGAYRAGYHRGGQSQGICRMVWENGNVFEGSYVDDCKSGQGSFIKYSDNTSYFGNFENDAKNGYGVEYYRNNTQYVGEFKNWKQHGRGKLIDSQTKKVIQEGQWKNGKFIGDICQL